MTCRVVFCSGDLAVLMRGVLLKVYRIEDRGVVTTDLQID